MVNVGKVSHCPDPLEAYFYLYQVLCEWKDHSFPFNVYKDCPEPDEMQI